MRIISISGTTACCEAGGIERDVDLWLMREAALAPGDFVLVHVGYAIQKVDSDAALDTWALHDSATGH
jgi:hydrogenase expression/formation protein HypC